MRCAYVMAGQFMNLHLGHATNNEHSDSSCNRISLHEACSEIITPIDAIRVLELDFNDHKACRPDDKGMSHEYFVQDGLRYEDGRYTVPLLLKSTDISLPSNKSHALKRLLWQGKKMDGDSICQEDYAAFMKNTLDR